MDYLIWGGTLVSLIGLLGLIYCIFAVVRARRSGLDDAALREKLQKMVALNLGALAVSTVGLMMVIIGISLGS